MVHNFPYLKDSTFLKQFDEIKIKQQFIKIIVLTFNEEKPIAEIQGKATGGNINLSSDSAMRRTGNISLIADDDENDLTDTKNLLSINKKIQILIGFTNTTNQYTNFPILWFPQGIFVIMTPNITHDSNGINISLSLHDKMALLNGECGGRLPASTTFSQVEDIDENGNIIIKQPTIYQIIQELVNHFGGEQLGKIIITDIDNKIKRVMKWSGSVPLYLYSELLSNGTLYNRFSTNYNQLTALGSGAIKQFSYGEDVGYILTDFTYPGELIGNAGDTVVTILDQIKKILGNYEYFYDIDGNFRFQQIKNYLNTSYSTFLINEINMNNYLVDYTNGKSVYTFEGSNLIQSYSNSPQYQQIKNDFLVWGKRKTIDGSEVPIRYHLTIDKKPKIGNSYKVFFFTDPDDGIEKAKKPFSFSSRADFPKKGQVGQYYYDENNNIIYTWNADTQTYKQTSYVMTNITTTDYRTELYMDGVNSQPLGLTSNYYYPELKNEWSKICEMKENPEAEDINERLPHFKKQAISQPNDIDFFLDFIDTTSNLSELNVSNIGRRTVVIVDNDINCVFAPTYPDLVIIEAGSNDADALQEECRARHQDYTQVRSEIYSLLIGGGVSKSAYDQIKKELYQYTSYNEQVSLTTIPIYYLEPNTRITIRDNQIGIFGDYIIKSISLPLDINGTMNLTCAKALERNV